MQPIQSLESHVIESIHASMRRVVPPMAASTDAANARAAAVLISYPRRRRVTSSSSSSSSCDDARAALTQNNKIHHCVSNCAVAECPNMRRATSRGGPICILQSTYIHTPIDIRAMKNKRTKEKTIVKPIYVRRRIWGVTTHTTCVDGSHPSSRSRPCMHACIVPSDARRGSRRRARAPIA